MAAAAGTWQRRGRGNRLLGQTWGRRKASARVPRKGRYGCAVSFTVTDNKGKVRQRPEADGLQDTEDAIAQKLATFAEGNRPPVQVL